MPSSVRVPAVHHRIRAKTLRDLSKIAVLRAIPPEEIHALGASVRRVRFRSGRMIIEKGAAANAAFFILSGAVKVFGDSGKLLAEVGAGGVVGEASLLNGTPRTASVVARSDIRAFRVGRGEFEAVLAASPRIREALGRLMKERAAGVESKLPHGRVWLSTALRSLEARSKEMPGWLRFMLVGLGMWAALALNERADWIPAHHHPWGTAAARLLIGLLVIQGACEAFVVGVERLGARLRWDGFISGTIGSMVSTLPEFVVIAFLVKVDPLAAFVTAVVTIFNNALIFSVYSFFLPKDRRGVFAMPRSLTIAGGELLIAGASISLIVGILMLVLRLEELRSGLAGLDLIIIGAVLIGIYAVYVRALVRYYAEGQDDAESVPPDPCRLGHDTRLSAILTMIGLGTVGAYCGGEAIGAFAAVALKGLGLPTIPTAAALAFFAGISEYIIVYKSHRRGELGIALSNVFGGMTQVMFLLLPCALLLIGGLGLCGVPGMAVPINAATTILVLLLFPLFYALHQYLELDRAISNLDAAALTGIYALLLYFLFTTPA